MKELQDDSSFKEEVLKNNLPVLVDFYADWCGPCKRISPLVEEIAAEFEGKAAVFKMNVDDNSDTAASLNISSIPALIFFKDGKETDRLVGFCRKEQIKQMLEKLL